VNYTLSTQNALAVRIAESLSAILSEGKAAVQVGYLYKMGQL
jgi:hypothetical protein